MNAVTESEIKVVSTLAPHQQRVVDEKRDLDDKLAKLSAFISSEKFSIIVQDEAERGRLVCQEELMKDYSAILAERIEAFGLLGLPVIEQRTETLEREIAAKSPAPRVTPADIEAEIASEWYFTAEQGAFAAFDPPCGADIVPPELSLLTFCVLVLRNGTKIVGVNEGSVSRENFDPEISRRYARAKAVDQIWPLLGFRLRDELARPVLTEADAAADLAGTPRP